MSQVADEKSVGPIESKNEIVMALQPSYMMGDLAQSVDITDTQLQSLSNDPRVMECLKMFNFGDITFKQIAQYLKFSENDMKLLNIFWEPTFNNSWIFLSEPMVCIDMRYASVRQFHADVLMKKYKLDEDWKEIQTDDPLCLSGKIISSIIRRN